jgi:hypothetical protein
LNAASQQAVEVRCAIIAAVKGWPAGIAALLFFMARAASAAEDGDVAARELARKTAAWAGRGEAVAVTWRNVSTLGSTELGRVRTAFETALREAGGRVSEAGSAAAQITISENPSDYLAVAEVRRGDDRQVWIASWKRSTAEAAGSSGATLEKKLVWEQAEPILDARFPGTGMLVLSPGKIAMYTRSGSGWIAQGAAALTLPKSWPRDARGLLKINGPAFRAFLPGTVCNGTAAEATVQVECKPSEEPWVLDSGSRSMLLAQFAAARNFFDGRAVTQSGVKKTLPPFYSAAAVQEQGKPLWLLAMVDGHTRIFDAALETGGTLGPWGSDLAGLEARCGGEGQVLATRPGDGGQPDAVQAFAIVNRAASAVTPAVEFPGPVTALWSTGENTAVAVSRNLSTGKYEAYVLTLVCGS